MNLLAFSYGNFWIAQYCVVQKLAFFQTYRQQLIVDRLKKPFEMQHVKLLRICTNCRLIMWRGRFALPQSQASSLTYMSASVAQLLWQIGSDVSSSTSKPFTTCPHQFAVLP